MSKIILSSLIIVSAFSWSASGAAITAVPSACVDALILSANLANQKDDPQLKKWRDKIASTQDLATKTSLSFVSSSPLPTGKWAPFCDKGLAGLLARLKAHDEKLAEASKGPDLAERYGLLNRLQKDKSPKQIEDEKALRKQADKERTRKLMDLSALFIDWLIKNNFEAEWQKDLQPAAKRLADSIHAWEASEVGKKSVANIAQLACSTAGCLNGFKVYVSGWAFFSGFSSDDKNWVIGPAMAKDLTETMENMLAQAYQSDVKWKTYDVDMMTSLQDPKVAQILEFKRYYRTQASYDSFGAKAIGRINSYILKRQSYPAILKYFLSFEGSFSQGDPLTAHLFMALKAAVDQGKKVSRADLENYFKKFEASDFDLKKEEFTKIMAPVNGIFGMVSGYEPEGVRVTLIGRNDPSQQLKKDDLITAINGKSLAGLSQSQVYELSYGKAGDKKALTLIRDGKKMQVTATLFNFDNSDIDYSRSYAAQVPAKGIDEAFNYSPEPDWNKVLYLCKEACPDQLSIVPESDSKAAEIHVISLAQGAKPKTDDNGNVISANTLVKVKKSPRPIILYLQSSASISWEIQAEPGTKIGKVIIGGDTRSVVAKSNVEAPVETGGQNSKYRNWTQIAPYANREKDEEEVGGKLASIQIFHRRQENGVQVPVAIPKEDFRKVQARVAELYKKNTVSMKMPIDKADEKNLELVHQVLKQANRYSEHNLPQRVVHCPADDRVYFPIQHGGVFSTDAKGSELTQLFPPAGLPPLSNADNLVWLKKTGELFMIGGRHGGNNYAYNPKTKKWRFFDNEKRTGVNSLVADPKGSGFWGLSNSNYQFLELKKFDENLKPMDTPGIKIPAGLIGRSRDRHGRQNPLTLRFAGNYLAIEKRTLASGRSDWLAADIKDGKIVIIPE